MKTTFSILCLLISQASCIAQQNETHSQLSKAQKDSLFLILQKYNAASYFVAPNISAEKLQNAKESCEVVKEDEILALIDMTVSGKAKHCILISSSGVYIHNGKMTTHPGRYFLSYSVLRQANISLK